MEENILDTLAKEGKISPEERASYAFHGELNSQGAIASQTWIANQGHPGKKGRQKGDFLFTLISLKKPPL